MDFTISTKVQREKDHSIGFADLNLGKVDNTLSTNNKKQNYSIIHPTIPQYSIEFLCSYNEMTDDFLTYLCKYLDPITYASPGKAIKLAL